jgi:phosphopantetheine adenylyltransferase
VNANDIVAFLKSFKWQTLSNIYGSAHPATIGFISTSWISQNSTNAILEGVFSPIRSGHRKGQRNADILLCQNRKLYVVVEVESSVSHYEEKLRTVKQYLHNYPEIQFGLLVMTNINTPKGGAPYVHNWDSIKDIVKKEEEPIALVSIEKTGISYNGDSALCNVMKKSSRYYMWQVSNIDFFICANQQVIEGNLWKSG